MTAILRSAVILSRLGDAIAFLALIAASILLFRVSLCGGGQQAGEQGGVVKVLFHV